MQRSLSWCIVLVLVCREAFLWVLGRSLCVKLYFVMVCACFAKLWLIPVVVQSLKSVMDSKRFVDQEDKVMLHERGWKHRYYMSKFGINIDKDPAFPRQVSVRVPFRESLCCT
jgi:hypothetical protein